MAFSLRAEKYMLLYAVEGRCVMLFELILSHLSFHYTAIRIKIPFSDQLSSYGKT